VRVEPMLSMIHDDWRQFLAGVQLTDEMLAIRRHERAGRPLGNAGFCRVTRAKAGCGFKTRETRAQKGKM
jgi:hypothetical protein